MEPINNNNIKELNDYCEYYLNKYQLKKTTRNPIETTAFSTEDYENLSFLIKSLNSHYIEHSKTNFGASYSYINKANKLGIILWKKIETNKTDSETLKNVANLRSLTLNNLGCYFKKCEKYVKALEYLENAMAIDKKGGADYYETAVTLINISAVLSKLENHEKALEHSTEAIIILERLNTEKEIPETLSTAYLNHAIEFEYLNNHKEAKINYENAYRISKVKLGENHSLTKNCLDKLVQFNFTHAAALEANYINITPTTVTNVSSSNLQKIQPEPLDIIYQTYLIFSDIRFKIIIINKPQKDCIKVLAFPENRYPVYRLLLEYDKVMEILKYSVNQKFNNIERDEIKRKMFIFSQYILIEKGELKINLDPIRNRPYSAGTNILVTTEKYGAKFSATLLDYKLFGEYSSKN